MCFCGVFLGVFWCLEERKNVERSWAESKFQKNVYPAMSDGCLGHENQGAAGGPSRVVSLKWDLIGLILTLLDRSWLPNFKRCGTRKSNGRSKVMALGSLRCIDRRAIPVYTTSRPF